MPITRWLVIALLTVLALGCDSVIREEEVSRKNLIVEHSCNKPDFCYTCLPGFDGKMECNFKFSLFCHGDQQVEVTRITTRRTHKSMKESFTYYDYKIREVTSCR